MADELRVKKEDENSDETSDHEELKSVKSYKERVRTMPMFRELGSTNFTVLRLSIGYR